VKYKEFDRLLER